MSAREVGTTPPDADLDRETRSLIRLSASLGTRDEERIREALAAAREDAEPVAVEEVLLQSHLFLGFPAALRALSLWREISGFPARSGDEDPADGGDGDESDDGPDSNLRRARGERLCRTVYGDQYEALRRNIRALHPAMERWMIEEGYGKVLTREGLDLMRRELAIAGLLAVQGAGVQLHSHLRGALRAGADPAFVEATLRLAEGYQGEAEKETARATWARVRRRRERRERG